MSEGLFFKAVLDDDNMEEIRRFSMIMEDLNFDNLYKKLMSLFPHLDGKFYITYKDDDGDTLKINNDEDLVIATMYIPPCVFKIRVNRLESISSPKEKVNSTFKGDLHPEVTCDGCKGSVYGFRYKCLSCSDYDLCAECEATGLHEDHLMIRISNPKQLWPGLMKLIQGMQKKVEAVTDISKSFQQKDQPSGAWINDAMAIINPNIEPTINDWLKENVTEERKEQLKRACQEAWTLAETLQRAALEAATAAAEVSKVVATGSASDLSDFQNSMTVPEASLRSADSLLTMFLNSLAAVSSSFSNFSESSRVNRPDNLEPEAEKNGAKSYEMEDLQTGPKN